MKAKKGKVDQKKQRERFIKALRGKQIPILILDPKWHVLFPEKEKTAEIKSLEKQLHILLKQQGKQVNENKEIKRLKKQLLSEIIENMDDAVQEQKIQQNQKLVQKMNERMQKNAETITQLPYEIQKVNEALLVESMQICYDTLHKQETELSELKQRIETMREELKKQVLRQQALEEKNQCLYSYFHQLLGAKVMELFDYQWEIGDQKN